MIRLKNYNLTLKSFFNLNLSFTLLCNRSEILTYTIIVAKKLSWVGQLNIHIPGILQILVTFESIHHHHNL